MLQDCPPGSAPRARSPRPDGRAIAGERLRARRRRVTRLRKRVIATALVTFVALWAVTFVQLVSGHDPALSQKSAAVTSTTSNGSSSGSGVTTSASGSGTTSASSGSGTTSAITTSQS